MEATEQRPANPIRTDYLVLVFPVEYVSFGIDSQCHRTRGAAVLFT